MKNEKSLMRSQVRRWPGVDISGKTCYFEKRERLAALPALPETADASSAGHLRAGHPRHLP